LPTSASRRAIGASESVTQTGLVMGTATYFSPEQAQGLGVDGRSDVYAFGVVLYEMVTGRPSRSRLTRLWRSPTSTCRKRQLSRAVIEPGCRAISRRSSCMLMPSSRRPICDRTDFHDDLERFMRGLPVLAQPPSPADAGAQTIAIPVNPTMVLSHRARPSPPTEIQERVPPPGAGAGQPEYPKRRFVPWVVAAIVLAAALVAIVYIGGRSLGYFGGAVSFHPRDVINMPYAKAESVLRGQGLDPIVTFKTGNEASKGLVTNQVPALGELVKKKRRCAPDRLRGPILSRCHTWSIFLSTR